MTLDLEVARALLARQLPRRASWLVGDTTLDYDFSKAHRPFTFWYLRDFLSQRRPLPADASRVVRELDPTNCAAGNTWRMLTEHVLDT